MADSAYVQEIDSWRASLDSDIKRADGPLTLVGLYWIQSGVQTIGSSRDCTFCLPKPAPRLIGAFESDGHAVLFRADVGQAVHLDGVAIQPGTAIVVRAEPSPSKLTLGTLTISPILYGDRLGIQARDSARPGLGDYPPRRWFSVDPLYAVRGMYTPYPAPAKVLVPDNIGGLHDGYAQGYVSFKLLGKSRTLNATESQDGRLFLQFRDRTNGEQTYSEGRFLHTDIVAEDGAVHVDFNRAFNPLAAFTAFSPSAVAPTANMLDCAIEAGECAPPPLQLSI